MKKNNLILIFLVLSFIFIINARDVRAEIKIDNIQSGNDGAGYGGNNYDDNNQDNVNPNQDSGSLNSSQGGGNQNLPNTQNNQDQNNVSNQNPEASSNPQDQNNNLQNEGNQNNNLNNAIIDLGQGDSLISKSQKFHEKAIKNNLGFGFSAGKKFYPNFFNKNEDLLNNFPNFLLSEVFVVKNFLINDHGSINSMNGIRFGAGKNFNNFNVILSLNLSKINLYDESSIFNFTKAKKLFIAYGLSCGYRLNKALDLRLNFVTTLHQKIKINQQYRKFSVNNFDIGFAYNF